VFTKSVNIISLQQFGWSPNGRALGRQKRQKNLAVWFDWLFNFICTWLRRRKRLKCNPLTKLVDPSFAVKILKLCWIFVLYESAEVEMLCSKLNPGEWRRLLEAIFNSFSKWKKKLFTFLCDFEILYIL
jgi:hypothetical protein